MQYELSVLCIVILRKVYYDVYIAQSNLILIVFHPLFVTTQPDKQHRFDLVVINRVFQFYSESESEWADMSLHCSRIECCNSFNY